VELQIINGGSVTVADEVFAVEYNEPLVHQVVVAYQAGGRAGTKAQKNRSAVRGGGRKPWAQKGTGRARAGTIRSPLWRSGGVTFAAQPRNFEQKVNKKMYRAAVRSIFAELARQERLVVVEDFVVESPKTKAFIEQMAGLGVIGRVLIVDAEITENLWLASRNLYKIAISDVDGLDPVSLVGAEKVIITKAALDNVGEWLS
jgi:large subunit ribosomal protein L4